MRLIDAIKHAKAKAVELREKGCAACAKEHEQIAAWLEELNNRQWIPVTERLPDTLVPVLIQHTYMEWAGITIGYITIDGYWEWFGYFMGNDMLHYPIGRPTICPGSKYVTHWMPLPNPYCAPAQNGNGECEIEILQPNRWLETR